LKKWLVHYHFGNELCAMVVMAETKQDAERHLVGMGYGTVQGEVVVELPKAVPLGIRRVIARLWDWWHRQ